MNDAIKTLLRLTLSRLGNIGVDFFNEISPLLLRLFRDIIDLVKVINKLKSHVFSFDEIGDILERSSGDLGEVVALSKRKKDEDTKAIMSVYQKQLEEIKVHPLDETVKVKLINKGNSFVKKISAYDEYKKLNQMLGLLKSIHNQDYEDMNNISTSLYAMMMCLKEGNIENLSQSLALIDQLYDQYKKTFETYKNWYIKH
jgi:DNA-binding transcriptional MerR regulator